VVQLHLHSERGRFLRDNAFLIAAVLLPLVVIAFFLLSTAIPRWLVPPPTHDLVLQVERGYGQVGPRLTVEYIVRDGRVEARVRPIPADTLLQPAALFLFDHDSLTVREIPVDLPTDLGENDPPRTFVVEALAGRRVLDGMAAPDGYRFESRSHGGPGLFGSLFGMNRYETKFALVNKGRAVLIELPSTPYQYPSSARAVGWLAGNGQR
jgi:hypothetical protein